MDNHEDPRACPEIDKRKYVYRPYITLKDGRILYAKTYGKKAFKIPIL